MDEDSNNVSTTSNSVKSMDDNFIKPSDSPVFKKPVLIGKIGKKIKPLHQKSNDEDKSEVISREERDNAEDDDAKKTNTDAKAQHKKATSQSHPLNIPYNEPSWGGIPQDKFYIEELKSGQIVNTVDLSSKSFYCIGRADNCHIKMLHPTVSRHHAILQYKATFDDKDESRGFYLYDNGSTHGTLLNKFKIKPKMYVRLHVGHMISFGSSTRFFILQGPSEDQEEESEMTVTELIEQRKLDKERKEIEEAERLRQLEEKEREDEEKGGIDWGMGEDAEEDEEENDLSVNPFAATNNEELYIDDPKKTLRGWFEREGEELNYDCEDKAVGEYICKVELPIEHLIGHNMTAEAIVKGKKKSAVVQCALEACRILDRYGLLRQANQEAKSKKRRKLDEDEYDSDDDTFFDRTGEVEAKRQKKMEQNKLKENKVETYETLLEKHKTIIEEINNSETKLINTDVKFKQKVDNPAEDDLDAYMSNLNNVTIDDKIERRKLKLKIINLKKEEEKLRKLINIAKPTSLPELKPPPEPVQNTKPQPSTNKKHINSAPSDNTADSTSIKENKGRLKDETEEPPGKKKSVKERSQEDRLNEDVEESSVSSSDTAAAPSTSSSSKRSITSTTDFINLHSKSLAASSKTSNKKKSGSSSVPAEGDEYSNTCWQPPKGQSGDGRTSLNDKYGY